MTMQNQLAWEQTAEGSLDVAHRAEGQEGHISMTVLYYCFFGKDMIIESTPETTTKWYPDPIEVWEVSD